MLDAGALVAVERDDRAAMARLRAAQGHGLDLAPRGGLRHARRHGRVLTPAVPHLAPQQSAVSAEVGSSPGDPVSE